MQNSSACKDDYVNKMLTAYADDLSVVLDKPYLMSDAELETAIEGYGQPGWSPPPIAEYVSNALSGRVSPFEVLQRQLEANGKFEPLETPESIQLLLNTIRPDFLELIQQLPTPERSNRGMGSIGSYQETLFLMASVQ